MSKKIYVTQPFLPPLEEFLPSLREIWDSKWVTNNGPFHQRLEREISAYLGVDHVSLFANGTLALITALQSLRITGEVITTPFSFVATTHALHWNGIHPVFADIDPATLNLDPSKIERAITPRTTAILPVHVYGNPCPVEEIQRIADVYGLKVIYDAAQAFAVRIGGTSILRHGDLSVLSFHGTKVFTTFEGGAIVCKDEKTKQRIDFLKNFGFADEVTVVAPGINAKMSEVQAALGLVQLNHMNSILDARARIDRTYREALKGVPGLRFLEPRPGVSWNYAYFPVLIESPFPVSRDALYEKLRSREIFARRYFYPLISDFPAYRGLDSAGPENLVVAKRCADQVLCLPIYPALAPEDQGRVIDAVREEGRKSRRTL